MSVMQRLGMPVNPVIRTEDAWRLASDPLVRQIQSSPVVAVLVPDDDSTSGPLPAAAGRSGDPWVGASGLSSETDSGRSGFSGCGMESCMLPAFADSLATVSFSCAKEQVQAVGI
jgi:hypothetical protein